MGLSPKPVHVYDPVQQLAIVDPDVLDLFGVDTIDWAGRPRSTTPAGPTGFCRTEPPARCPHGLYLSGETMDG